MAEKADKAEKKKLTIDEILVLKTGVVRTIEIQVDGEVADQLERLRLIYNEALDLDHKSNKPDEAPKIKEQIEELIDQSKATLVEFRFQSIGREKYDNLVESCKPTADQKKQGMPYDPLRFAPALIASACIEPEMTLEQATEIFDSPKWNNAQVMRLFHAAQEANDETGDIPFSKIDTGRIGSSVSSLITRPNVESLIQSSPDGS